MIRSRDQWAGMRESVGARLLVATSPRALGWLPDPVPRAWKRFDLLALGDVGWGESEALRAIFGRVVANPAIRFVGTKVLMAILGASDAVDRFIGALVSETSRSVVLIRGDLRTLAIPLPWFEATPTGVTPDFADVEIIDHGYSVRLGDYEASSDAILYEFDRDFRARERRRRLDMDPSFGAALRRLRLQKGVARSGFPGISEKEIAKIERGEVETPHAGTIRLIAERLGVAPSEVATY